MEVMFSVRCSAVVALFLVALVPSVTSALETPTEARIPGWNAEFYTFGWSEDGKIAYALVDTPPFRTGYGFTFAVVDARTDEVLVSIYDHSDQFPEQDGARAHHEAWNRNAAEVQASLERYAIRQVGETIVEPFPLQTGTDRYDVAVREWRVDPATQPYGNGVVGYTVSFSSGRRGTKVVASRGRLWATDVTPVGFVRSPFENRVAIIVAESGNASGDNRFTDFTIAGAHLDLGF
jgi:hypothetical protein